MAEGKKSVLLYCDIIHTVNKLTDEQAGKLFKHYLSYINDENPVTDDIVIQIAFEPIKQSLKRDLKKWENIREKRVLAGKASAESRKQNEQVSTHVKSVEQNSTKSTVSDSVNVSVNDSVNVNVINKIMVYFGFTEMRNFDKLRDITQFVNVLVNQEKIKEFENQFEAYKQYKEKSKTMRHGFKNFLGDIKESYSNGGWCAENWIHKLKEIDNQNSLVKKYNINKDDYTL